MIIEIHVTERYTKDTLADQRRHLVLDLRRRPTITEAPCKPLEYPDSPVGRTQLRRWASEVNRR